MRPFCCLLSVLLTAGMTPKPSYSQSPAMKKIVTNQATFVVYVPEGWEAAEQSHGTCRTLTIADPGSGAEAALAHAVVTEGEPIDVLISLWKTGLPQVNHVQLREAYISDEGRRIVLDGSYERGPGGRKTFRAWLCKGDGVATISRIDAPDGEFENQKQQLLTVLSNVRITKGSMLIRSDTAVEEPLSEHRLADGSARFLLPQQWEVKDFGTCSFVATAPSEASCFIVGKVQFLTPALGVRAPGVPVSEYLPPHKALQLVATQGGLARDVRFLEVIPRTDINQQIGAVFTAGTVQAEEFVYTATSPAGVRTKGYTFGVSFRSRWDLEWQLWHMTVSVPEEDFADRAPMLARMMLSYRINDDFAARYIADGIARLRVLQRQTSELVARNASEIHSMMQAAYEERQRSWDYIDYQRTSYIRGQQDWISSLEGGRVYHTDSWGTLNTDTGAYYEGTAYDYVHFDGESPRYHEMMTPVDSRALWERYIRN